MTSSRCDKATVPPWTLPGFTLGMRLALPVLPGMVAFGLAVGATAARKGLGFLDNLLMNLFVYAGMSQLVALEAWPERFTLSMALRLLAMANLSGPACADRSILADQHALSRRGRIGRGHFSRIERSTVHRLDSRDLRRPCRRHADRRSAPLRHRPRHADLFRRHADSALAGRAARHRVDRRRRGRGHG